MLNRNKFNYLIILLSNFLYFGDKNRVQNMFNDMLAEKSVVNKDQVEHSKSMIFDETNKKLLFEPVIDVFLKYELDLQRLFTLYTSENLGLRKQMLTWKELSLQNRKMTAFCLVKCLREAEILPNVLNVELLEEILMKIMPAVTLKQHQFYSNSELINIYDHQNDRDEEPQIEGSPHLCFHEFMLVLGRIAYETYPNELMDKSKKQIEIPVDHFFQNIICLRNNEDIRIKKIADLNRKMFIYMRSVFEEDESAQKEREDEQIDKEKNDYFENPKKIMQEYQQKNLFLEDIVNIEYEEIFKTLDRELPPMPAEIIVEKINPPPYTMPKRVIGDQLPKPPPDKNKPRPKPPKKPQRKKGEPEPRKIIWEGFPDPAPKTSYENLYNYENDIDFDEPLVSSFDKATFSYIEVQPCIIKEVLYPPQVPIEIQGFLEAALLAHSQFNYPFALENFQLTRQQWLAVTKREELPEQVQLFFEYSEGQVYESSGRDDKALQKYWNCKALGEKLSFNNPDRALAFCGLGSIFFNMEEYILALRSFLKAREIRESLVGQDTVDTASIYNNIGCCMLVLKRFNEAFSYFKLAHVILQTELGNFHQRTMTALRNLSKIKKCCLKFQPSYRQLWEIWEENKYKKKKKGKKKKKKN